MEGRGPSLHPSIPPSLCPRSPSVSLFLGQRSDSPERVHHLGAGRVAVVGSLGQGAGDDRLIGRDKRRQVRFALHVLEHQLAQLLQLENALNADALVK